MRRYRRFVHEAKTRWLELRAQRTFRLPPGLPLVSLSFDDVPRSVLERGLPMLERHGAGATLYACLEISPASGHLSPDDLLEISDRGFEIGCHTLTHYDLRQGDARGLARDAAENKRRLGDLLGKPVSHFAFPFGAVSHRAKRLLGSRYRTLRSTQPGVNRGTIDLNLLRAVSLESPRFCEESVATELADVARQGGWLVFLSHGVTEQAGRYDVTPRQLQTVLSLCDELDIRIRSMGDAADLAGVPP